MTKVCHPQIEAWPHIPSSIESFISLGLYHEPLLEHAMDLYKFHRATELARDFAALLAPGMQELLTRTDQSSLSPIILIPVPLHKRRIRERGFDQNLLLAKMICHFLQAGLPEQSIHYRDDLVIRTRHTKHQTTVTANERITNLENAFELTSVASSAIPNATVILIDDIVTTGATLNELAGVVHSLQPRIMHAASVLRSSLS